MLNEQLSQMQHDGLIKKTIYEEAMPRVEYELTKKGSELLPALKMIESWAIHYSQDGTKKSNCTGFGVTQITRDNDAGKLTQCNCH